VHESRFKRDSAIMVDNKDVTKRYMSFSEEQHPFLYNDWYSIDSKIISFCAPRKHFSTSAQRYCEGMTGSEEINACTMEILSLFLYLYDSIYDCMFTPNKKTKKKKKKRGVNGAIEEDEENEVTLTTLEQELELEASYQTNSMTNLSPSGLFAVMEVVPHYTLDTRVACINLRITANNEAVNFGSKLFSLFVNNARRKRAEREGKPPLKNPQLYHSISFERYCDLVGMYTGKSVHVDERQLPFLSDTRSNINPLNVFHLQNTCKKAASVGANPAFKMLSNYVDQNGVFGFPSADRVYMLTHEVMKPELFHTFLWPHVAKPTDEHDQQRLLYIRQFIKSAEEDPDTNEDVRAAEEKRLSNLYDQYYRCKVSDDNAMSIKGLAVRQKRRWAHMRLISGGRFDDMKDGRLLVQKQGIGEFSQIFHVDGDVPDSIKAIAKWIDKHLHSYKNFNLPMSKISKNMSRFADFNSSFSCQLECMFKVAVFHVQIIKGWYASIETYSNAKMHCHTLVVGKQRLGKSFIFRIQQILLIFNTWREYAFATAKADTGGGSELNHMIEYMEEAMPDMLGCVYNTAQRKAQATSGNNTENMMKIKTTNGELTVKRAEPDKLTNKIKTVVTVTECNGTCHLASNDPLCIMSPPVVDRYDAYEVYDKQRKDGGDIISKVYAFESANSKDALTERVYRFQRNQVMCAMIFYAINAGIFPNGINMVACSIVFSSVLRRAKTASLIGTDNARNVVRLCCLVQAMVVISAADKLLDSEMSPFKGKPWKDEDLLAFEPYLVATVEMCTFALGLLHNLFESDLNRDMIKTLRNTIFYKSVADVEPYPNEQAVIDQEEAMYMLQNPRADKPFHNVSEERSMKLKANKDFKAMRNPLYYVCEFPVVNHHQPVQNQYQKKSSSQYAGADRPLTKDELLERLRDHVLRKMKNKPKGDELLFALNQLTETTIEDETGNVTGADFALFFSENKAYLAKSTVENSGKYTLKGVITEVLSKLSTKRRQYIYGVANEELPYVFDSIIVEPCAKAGDSFVVTDPNYFDEQVKHFNELASSDMYEELIDKTEKHGSAERKNFMSTVFSNTPYLKLDGDIDRYCVALHLADIYHTSRDSKGMPSPFPDVFAREIADKQFDRELPMFPACFPKTAKQVKDGRKKRKSTADMSVSSKTTKLLDGLGFKMPDEEDSLICYPDSTETGIQTEDENGNNSDDEKDDEDAQGGFLLTEALASILRSDSNPIKKTIAATNQMSVEGEEEEEKQADDSDDDADDSFLREVADQMTRAGV